MADIKVVIQLQDTDQDEIGGVKSTSEINNASISKTNNTFNSLATANNGRNLKSWATGSLSLADGIVGGANTQLIEQYGYNGYMFGYVPFDKKLTVTLEVVGKYIDSIVVYGDKMANQFPTKAYRDGNTNDIIYSDDPVWAIKFDKQATSHTITFLEWNRADYNACITYIAELKNELVIDKSSLKSLESLKQATSQPKTIYYGVTPSRADISVLDANEEFLDMLQDGIIPKSSTNLKIMSSNSLIDSHIVDISSYSDKKFNLECSDILGQWQKRIIEPKVLDASSNSLFGFFENAMVSFGFTADFVNNMCSNIIRDGKTAKEIMQDINIPYQFYKATTLGEFIDSICMVCQMYVVCDNLGTPKFVNGLPTFQNETILKIPKKIQFGASSNNPIIENKISNIRYKKSSFNANIKDVCALNMSLRDSDGNFDTTALEGYYKTTYQGVEYLGFFLECSDANAEFMYTDGAIQYPFTATSSDGTLIKSAIRSLNMSKSDAVFADIIPNIVVGLKIPCVELLYERTLNSKTFAVVIANGFSLTDLSINILQKVVSKNTKEVLFNLENENIYEFGDSEFMSIQSKVQGKDIYSHNIQNILNSYDDGIHTANISIGCLDIYDISGNKVKDWSLGEIIEIGDIVRVDRDNENNSLWKYHNGEPMYWKVTGRNFRKVGVPMLDLELQEVKQVV